MSETLTNEVDARETLQRVRRIETRLMRLCGALSVDPTNDKVRVTIVSPAPNSVLEVAGYDVSYGDLLAFCRKSGINGLSTVCCRGKVIGTVLSELPLEGGNV